MSVTTSVFIPLTLNGKLTYSVTFRNFPPVAPWRLQFLTGSLSQLLHLKLLLKIVHLYR